ncbi:MAG: hypothetical protein DMG15_00825 [Acidobacteria bacterium]|nr:MAG: hypothetical protein DMG15_00825 [Acidobacteriota bacterium]
MRTRTLRIWGALALFMALPLIVLAQAPSGTATFKATAVDPEAAIKAAADAAKAAAAAAANWRPPRTSWGDPDLQGFYLSLSYTPLERPPELRGKPFYTEEEAIAAFRKAVEADAEVDPRTVHYDWKEYGMDAWQSPVRPNLHTSLIVDPPDGRIPALTPAAQKRQAAARGRNPQLGVATLGNLYTRCITGNQGPPRLPFNHDSESQILQTPGYVVMILQSNNDVRIIPLDGRPHLPQNVGLWLGDARGHWEADTLVVETTNFHHERNWRGSTDGMKLTERFTLVDPKTIRYEFTVDDSTTWVRPWSVESVLPRIEPPLYEFACHEQNYGLMNVVKGARAREAEAAARKN